MYWFPPNFGHPEAKNIHSNFSTLFTVILVHDPSPRANHSFLFLEIRPQALKAPQLPTRKKRVKLQNPPSPPQLDPVRNTSVEQRLGVELTGPK